MAKSTVTHVTDDIDGTPDAQTVTFGLQGIAYSIDLSQKNLDKLTKALAPYVEHAARQRGAARAAAAPKAARAYDLVQLREWAGKNKIKLPSRGRIPATIIEQYQTAGGR